MSYSTLKLAHFTDYPYLLQSFLNYDGTIKNKAVNTVKAYALDLKNLLQYIVYKRDPDNFEDVKSVNISQLDEMFFNSITQDEILEYLYFLKTARRLSAQTRSRYLAAIKVFFDYLYSHKKVISNNPAYDIDTPKKPKHLPVHLTFEESVALLANIDSDNKYYERNYCILTLFLNCGFRLSELVNINITDIRTDTTVKVTGKGDKQRMLYLNDACINAINNYLKVRADTEVEIVDKNALFISPKTGKRLSPRRIQQIVDAALESAGLNNRGFSTHKLRHTAATLMYQNGVDVRTLKDVLGHEQLSTTQIYTHLNREQLRNAAERNPLADIKSDNKN